MFSKKFYKKYIIIKEKYIIIKKIYNYKKNI
jgi:hypothetical protein